MRQLIRMPNLLIAGSMVVTGCHQTTQDQRQAAPSPSASVAASSAPSTTPAPTSSSPARRPAHEITAIPTPEQVKIRGAAGLWLKGSYWKSSKPHAPALLLAHSLGADRHEWDKLLQRLALKKGWMSVLAVDLRGHGRTAQGGAGAKHWSSMKESDFSKIPDDMVGVLRWTASRPTGAPTSVVLLGSDLGATAWVRAVARWKSESKRSKGKHELCVAAVGLVSPGAKLRGLDIYRPFSALRNTPVLIVASASDTISNDPVRHLANMGTDVQTDMFPGRFHGLRFVTKKNERVWDDLATWVEQSVKRGCGKRSGGDGSKSAASGKSSK